MTDQANSSATQLVQSWLDLNLRYFRAITDATVDYYRSVGKLYSEQSPLRGFGFQFGKAAPTPAAPAASDAPSATVILEGAIGDEPRGGFVVANRLPRQVSASFAVEPITDGEGHRMAGNLNVDPPAVTLDAGKQSVVHVGVRIGEQFQPGVDYRGSVSAPGIADAPIAVVVRRRLEVAKMKAPADRRRKPRSRK